MLRKEGIKLVSLQLMVMVRFEKHSLFSFSTEATAFAEDLEFKCEIQNWQDMVKTENRKQGVFLKLFCQP